MKQNLLALAGAAAGGVVGYFAFVWLVHQGFYALVLPGALLGLGASLSPNKSLAVAIVCGLSALALGLFSEWRVAPFIKDDGLAYFLTHILQLKGITLLMIGAGAFVGFWAPFRRLEVAKLAPPGPH